MKLIITTTSLVLLSSGAFAQELVGATVGASYESYSDIDELATTTFDGGIEVSVASQFAVAGDLSIYNVDGADESASNFTVHGIYSVSPDLKVGAFLGRDSIADLEIDNYGVEAAYTSGPVSAQGYFGIGDDGFDDVTYFGVSGGFEIIDGLSLIAAYDSTSIQDGDGTVSKIEAGAEYAIANGASVFATVGQLQIDFGFGTGEEDYVGIGAAFDFGANGGTTFGGRSFFNSFPAFGAS